MRADVERLKFEKQELQERLDDCMSECNQMKELYQNQALLIEMLMQQEAKDVKVWRNVATYWKNKYETLKEYYDTNVITIFR